MTNIISSKRCNCDWQKLYENPMYAKVTDSIYWLTVTVDYSAFKCSDYLIANGLLRLGSCPWKRGVKINRKMSRLALHWIRKQVVLFSYLGYWRTCTQPLYVTVSITGLAQGRSQAWACKQKCTPPPLPKWSNEYRTSVMCPEQWCVPSA